MLLAEIELAPELIPVPLEFMSRSERKPEHETNKAVTGQIMLLRAICIAYSGEFVTIGKHLLYELFLSHKTVRIAALVTENLIERIVKIA